MASLDRREALQLQANTMRRLGWRATVSYRRLARRYERSAAHFLAFADIACAMICYNHLTK